MRSPLSMLYCDVALKLEGGPESFGSEQVRRKRSSSWDLALLASWAAKAVAAPACTQAKRPCWSVGRRL